MLAPLRIHNYLYFHAGNMQLVSTRTWLEIPPLLYRKRDPKYGVSSKAQEFHPLFLLPQLSWNCRGPPSLTMHLCNEASVIRELRC